MIKKISNATTFKAAPHKANAPKIMHSTPIATSKPNQGKMPFITRFLDGMKNLFSASKIAEDKMAQVKMHNLKIQAHGATLHLHG